jgi:hypothetical protein
MFLLDSLMISGIKWVMKTVITSAEAEMNDDTALREQLLEAEMRREMGEISDDEFAEVEADLLGRIREIKERREGAGPLAFGGAEPVEKDQDSRFAVEASVSGDFYDPADAPHTTVVETTPVEGQILTTVGGDEITVLDMEPGPAEPPSESGLPLSAPARRARARRQAKAPRTNRTVQTPRTKRTARKTRTGKISK